MCQPISVQPLLSTGRRKPPARASATCAPPAPFRLPFHPHAPTHARARSVRSQSHPSAPWRVIPSVNSLPAPRGSGPFATGLSSSRRMPFLHPTPPSTWPRLDPCPHRTAHPNPNTRNQVSPSRVAAVEPARRRCALPTAPQQPVRARKPAQPRSPLPTPPLLWLPPLVHPFSPPLPLPPPTPSPSNVRALARRRRRSRGAAPSPLLRRASSDGR